MKKTILLLLLCAIPSATRAAQLMPIVMPERSLTENVIVILDTSGSMSGKPIGTAFSAVALLMGRAARKYNMKLIAFRNEVHVWPKGWVEMPDPSMIAEARRWVYSLGGAYGTTGETFASPAVRLALSEERPNLSVVLISDGEFTFGSELVNLSLEIGQKLRVDRQLGEAVLMCIGIGRSHPRLEELGRMGKGGMYLITDKREVGQPRGF